MLIYNSSFGLYVRVYSTPMFQILWWSPSLQCVSEFLQKKVIFLLRTVWHAEDGR